MSVLDAYTFNNKSAVIPGITVPRSPIQTSPSSGGGSTRAVTPVESVRLSDWLNEAFTGTAEGAVGFVGAAATAPARVIETPFALAFQGIEKATGRKPEQDIMGVPILGDVIRGLGSLYEGITKPIWNWQNQNDSSMWKKYAGRSLTDSLDAGDMLGRATGGLFNLGAFADTATPLATVGDLRNDLLARGWSEQDLADLAAGKRSEWDFGDKALSSNFVADLATRVVLDPTNLIFSSIPAKIAARGSRLLGRTGREFARADYRWAVPEGSNLSELSGIESGVARNLERLAGNPLAVSLAKHLHSGEQMFRSVRAAGGRSEMGTGIQQVASNIAAKKNLVTGTVAGMGWYSSRVGKAARLGGRFTRFMLDPRGYTTRQGYLKRAATQYTITAALSNMPDGVADDIKQFGEDTLTRQPISSSMTFVLAAAMLTPGALMARNAMKETVERTRTAFGSDRVPVMEQLYDRKWDDLVKDFAGGEEGLNVHIFNAAAQVVRRDHLYGMDPALSAALESMSEAGVMAEKFGDELRQLTYRALADRKVSMSQIEHEIIDQFERPEAYRGAELQLPDGSVQKVEALGARGAWHADTAIYRHNENIVALGGIRDVIFSNIEHTRGLRGFYTKEQMKLLLQSARGLFTDEFVDIREVRKFIDRNMLLGRMPGREKYATYLSESAPPRVRSKEFIDDLQTTLDNPVLPSNAEMYVSDRAYDIKSLLRQRFGTVGEEQLSGLRAQIEVSQKADGTPLLGMEKANATFKRILNKGLMDAIRRGNRKTVASRKELEQVMRSELTAAEGMAGMEAYQAGLRTALDAISEARAGRRSIEESLEDVMLRMDREVEKEFAIPIISETLERVPQKYRTHVERDAAYIAQLTDNYTAKRAPALNFVPHAGDKLPDIMLKQRNAYAYQLFDNGPLSNLGRAINSLFTPVRSSRMHSDMLQAVYDHMIGKGTTKAQIDVWLADLREISENSLLGLPGGRVELRLYGGPTRIVPHAINISAIKAFGKDSLIVKNVGENNFYRILDLASSRTWRGITDDIRRGGTSGRAGELQRWLKSPYYTYRTGLTESGKHVPVWTSLSLGGRVVGSTLYSIFRFASDARYWAMNVLERNLLAIGREGVAAGTGSTKNVSLYTQRLGKTQMDAAAGESAASKMLADAHESGWSYSHMATQARIFKSFDVESPESALKVVRELWDTDPAILKMRRDFPEATPVDYLADLEAKFRNFDDIGVAESLKQAYRRLYSEKPELAAAAWENKVVLQRLGEVNRQLFDDVRKVHYGNPDRTNIERVLNSFWLYWPLSYQIKTGKWMVRMLTERAFGQNTNLAGAFKYAELREMFIEEMGSNLDFANLMNDNEHLWRAAMMMFPITPEDLGVNLSRPFRLAGSFLGIFEPMKGRDDPFAWAAYIMEIGPVYTYKILNEIASDWTIEEAPVEEPSQPGGTLKPTTPTIQIGGQPIQGQTPISSPLGNLGG